MSALRKIQTTTIETPEATMFDGAGTELFISGSAPAGTDMTTGSGTELFISGSAPQDSDMKAGSGTELFISGSAPSDSTVAKDGDAVGAFISGS